MRPARDRQKRAGVANPRPKVGPLVLVRPPVVLGADDVEVLVELDIDLASIIERDLDLVVALFVANLGAGDLALADARESGGLCPLEGGARDRPFAGVIAARGDRRAASNPGEADDERADGCVLAC
jgi:hypothetical protein